MAVQKEVWINDVQENLFQGAEFILNGTDHSAFVSNSIVHVPQAGSASAVVKNRSSLPATIAQRTDADFTYPIDDYTTDPILIKRIDEIQTSYAKRMSVMKDHIDGLNESIGLNVANAWAADGGTVDVDRVFTTTGAATADAPTGSTQTPKRLLQEDIIKLAKKFDKDNIPSADRYLLLPVSMYYDLFNGSGNQAILRKDYLNATSIPTGVVDILYNFKIMIRPDVVLFPAASTTKKAVGAAPAITDVFGGIAWHKSAVAYAKEAINVYERENNPEYYGAIISAEVLMGSKLLRADFKGVASIKQGV